MKACEIFHVNHKKSFRWKWRHNGADGRAVESKESYALYFECVTAAREAGYEPRRQQRTPAAA
ncbi:MAG TPA: hypothetical protein VEQ87_06820 [Burkholderiales bacterium]|nr:hypothetical protein [Burkholderiales bacterium]